MRSPAQLITSVAFVLLTFGGLALAVTYDNHKPPSEARVGRLGSLLRSAHKQMTLRATHNSPAHYNKALQEIVYWLDALQRDRVSRTLAPIALKLWDRPGIYTGLERFTLAAKLSREYSNIFNAYTGVHNNADISDRNRMLIAEFGLLNREKLALRAEGYDWDFDKIERGLLWHDAKKRKAVLRPTTRQSQTDYANMEKALAMGIHKDLMEGLDNCIRQIEQGSRGSADLDSKTIYDLVRLPGYFQSLYLNEEGALVPRPLFRPVPLGGNPPSSALSPSPLGAQSDYGDFEHTEPTEYPPENPAPPAELASADDTLDPAYNLDIDLPLPNDLPWEDVEDTLEFDDDSMEIE